MRVQTVLRQSPGSPCFVAGTREPGSWTCLVLSILGWMKAREGVRKQILGEGRGCGRKGRHLEDLSK
jgi:hypothetical protein